MEAPMFRKAFAFILLIALVTAAAPLVSGDTVRGTGVGAEVGGHSAGRWHQVDAIVPGNGPRDVTLTLTWGDRGLLADYDLTIWEPGADADGALTDDEVVAGDWRLAYNNEIVLTATLHGGETYPVTVEPIFAPATPWTLVTWHADLDPRGTLIVGTKVTHP